MTEELTLIHTREPLAKQVASLFMNINEWNSQETWNLNIIHDDFESDISHIKRRMNLAFMAIYKDKFPGSDVHREFESAFLRIPKDRVEEFKRALADQVVETGEKLGADEPDDASEKLQRNFARKKEHRYRFDSKDGKKVLHSSVIEQPIPGDKNHVCIGIYIHSYMRDAIATDIINQQTAARQAGN